MLQTSQKRLLQQLFARPELGQRVERVVSIRGLGENSTLTWELENAFKTNETLSDDLRLSLYCHLAESGAGVVSKS